MMLFVHHMQFTLLHALLVAER